MLDWLRDPAQLRLSVFLGGLLLFMLLERTWPRRHGSRQIGLRWPANLGLVLVGAGVIALLPLAAIGTAAWAQMQSFGLLHQVQWPFWFEIGLAWLLLDLGLYWQHRWMHIVPLLWRLHRVHHSDTAFDVTTGVRFHPVEILLSMGWKMLLVALLGAPVLAVLLLELTLNTFALWSHTNLRYPPALESVLRRAFITPEMHRIHHSVHLRETNSNYSSSVSIWDHLFRSYTAEPRDGHERMQLGLQTLRTPAEQSLPALLIQPLKP